MDKMPKTNQMKLHNMVNYTFQRDLTWASVLKLEVLVLKLVAIDGLSTSAIVVGEISALAHELGDDAMES